MEKNINITDRLYGLDLLRILAALFIFFFHSNVHMKLTYGWLTPFIKNGAIFMIAFFELSGFTLYYLYAQNKMETLDTIKIFYKKRFANIYPLYIVIYILYLIVYNQLTLKENIILAPIELTLTQTFFGSLFTISHNDGTWFISCIAFCYLLFPYFSKLFSQIKSKNLIFIALMMYGLDSIAPFVAHMFKLNNVYSNPFFRLMEFLLGLMIAHYFMNTSKKECKQGILFFSIVALISGISLMSYLGIGNYSYYGFWTIPFFTIIIFYMGTLKNKTFIKILGSKLIQYLSKISYAFFLAQFFVWDILRFAQKYLEILKTNSMAIVFSLFVCSLIAIILYEIIEKPCKKWLLNKIL